MPTVRLGSTGADVEQLQELLNRYARAVGSAPMRVDGSFGPATERAVKDFQEAAGLTADGVAGEMTWRALRAATAPGAGGLPGSDPAPPVGMVYAAAAQRAEALRHVVEGESTIGLMRERLYPGSTRGPWDLEWAMWVVLGVVQRAGDPTFATWAASPFREPIASRGALLSWAQRHDRHTMSMQAGHLMTDGVRVGVVVRRTGPREAEVLAGDATLRGSVGRLRWSGSYTIAWAG
jgi:hypothetical protein